mmetsp:Transcript_27215/g.31057  ORF Transcript_27215/g.31057 Transcript_27215/m.31057 type:complete len:400 (-) Transcript_27215:190-1389(-)
MAESPVTVNLTLANVPNSSRVSIQVDPGDSPEIFKEKAAKATKIPLDSIRLIFRGRLVGNETNKKVIEDFKLEDGSVIHCIGKPVEEKSLQDNSIVASQNVVTGGSKVTMSGVAQESTEIPGDNSKTLINALATLRSGNSAVNYLTAVTTFDKVLSNITNNPMEEKYRKVKCGNVAFNRRLGGLPGGEAAMLAVGFSIENDEGEECYILHPTPTAWPKLMAHKIDVEQAVKSAKNVSTSTPNPNSAGIGRSASGISGSETPSMGTPGMPPMTPQMQQAAAQMMQNPQQLQAMLQNPLVQNMLRNNPRFANSPMRQHLDQMANNPQLLQQVSHLMQNPDLMNMMMNMGALSGMGGLAEMPSQSQQDVGNGSEGNDQEMTEEEMIQEAIRRSLNENNDNHE